MKPLNEYNQRILLQKDEIDAAVRSMGQRILEDYADEPLTLIGCLKGSFIFMADLVRARDELENGSAGTATRIQEAKAISSKKLRD